MAYKIADSEVDNVMTHLNYREKVDWRMGAEMDKAHTTLPHSS